MDKFLSAIFKSKWRRVFYASAYILLCFPIIALSVFSYRQAYNDLTNLTLSNRQAIAYLAANNLQENFDHLTALGLSFATRVRFREVIAEGNLAEAIKLLEPIPTDFPDVERLFITDLSGTELADTPHLPGAVGKNFSDRDWYQGVSREWKPYVSEIYKRAAEPRLNVVAVAVPILDNNQEPMAILVVQVRIDAITDWSKQTDVGTGGFVYFVDKKGQVASHFKASSEGEILDFSSVEIVQKVLKGQSGVEVNFNPVDQEERLAAYEPVIDYGWGAIATQPTLNAFSERTKTLRVVTVVFGFIIFLNFAFVWFLLRFLQTIDRYRIQQETFLESIGDGVMAIDRGFDITLFNAAAERLTGFSSLEAIGKPMREITKFVREKDKTENITFIEEAMLFGKAKQMANGTVLITKSGAEIPVGDSAAPILGGDGKVNGAIIVFRDVTQEREVKRMKDEFISVASHELRTPMTAISGFVSMILGGVYGPVNEDLKEPLGYIGEGSDRLIKLVSDMLNVSRIEAGRLKFELTSLDLSKLASEVVKSLAPVAEEKGINLSFKDTETPLVQADADKVRQILNNLIGNSLKFTNKGGSITVSLAQDGDYIKTYITDTGIGIAPEEQKKLFEKFVQIASQENGRPKGTGLGLYISRELAKKMGGDLWIESSQVSKGSSFAFSLPLADTEEAKKIFEGEQKESGLHPDQKPLEEDIAKKEE